MAKQQQTIGASIGFNGVGVHSGEAVELTLHPADAGTGVVFQVTTPSGGIREIKAVSANVSSTDLATVVGEPNGPGVATIEHLMAALYAMEIDNVIVEIEGREVPIMDGCSHAFVQSIREAGFVPQLAARRYVRVLKPVRVEMGSAYGEYRPHDSTRFEIDIDFSSAAIGRQSFKADLTPDLFCEEISRARTFGFMKDVERLWASGHALGSSLENSVVIGDDDGVINPGGLRYVDEFVRHKALDAIGDQALAGARILGCYRSYRGGHRLNAMALQALLSDPTAFEMVEVPVRTGTRARRELSIGAASPAYEPQKL
ncbi:UDP-3-O-acyl-N-acetylglucosamine deacetylase [Aureimonas fodinaquatilis]|uniref:UDP-3-O-acyl-N-acetylglucosamine deacetylase n=1 Tax=Aureimonas fodinaquatilis TaxID=2565783 RepID=A0A5B0E1Q8_9HYPH|nr:UDP-3-O-acyl-N-acetylglucosamine deacetylase [Aureimonas fodinaquatilis]KAA0972588.1 UDP-3-O-acyl-N-acetylglucosamine deacetylase [Aureimonas fodinaquatilis]